MLDRNFFIPIGVGLTLLLSISGAIYMFGRVHATIDRHDQQLERIEQDFRSVPSRQEYDQLKSDIKEIKTDLKSLITKLAGYNVTYGDL